MLLTYIFLGIAGVLFILMLLTSYLRKRREERRPKPVPLKPAPPKEEDIEEKVRQIKAFYKEYKEIERRLKEQGFTNPDGVTSTWMVFRELGAIHSELRTMNSEVRSMRSEMRFLVGILFAIGLAVVQMVAKTYLSVTEIYSLLIP